MFWLICYPHNSKYATDFFADDSLVLVAKKKKLCNVQQDTVISGCLMIFF